MKNEKIKFNLNINNPDNDYNYIWNEFKSKPNRVKVFDYYSKDEFLALFDSKDTVLNREIFPSEDFYIKNDIYLSKISDNIFVSYIINDSDSEDCIVTDVTFFYKSESDYTKIQELIDSLSSLFLEDDKVLEADSNLYSMLVSDGNIQLEPIEYDVDENIELFYNDTTFKSVRKLAKNISSSNSGLSILYGERGNGKTSILKYIVKKLNKNVIFIPNNLIDTISNPEFKNFIRTYHDSVLVLDDCEYIFNDFYSKTNTYTNTILQNLDSISSLNINYLMIFNSDRDNIDSNLLECNNIIDIIEFKELDKESAKELAKHLGYKDKNINSGRLVDILNKKTTEKVNKIGLS